MKDSKGMDSAQYKGAKVMKNHGNTSSIKADAQKYDMGRLQKKSMSHKGNSEKAYDYKY
jgi:hypothetical protein